MVDAADHTEKNRDHERNRSSSKRAFTNEDAAPEEKSRVRDRPGLMETERAPKVGRGA